jgi:hypothetical protein
VFLPIGDIQLQKTINNQQSIKQQSSIGYTPQGIGMDALSLNVLRHRGLRSLRRPIVFQFRPDAKTPAMITCTVPAAGHSTVYRVIGSIGLYVNARSIDTPSMLAVITIGIIPIPNNLIQRLCPIAAGKNPSIVNVRTGTQL